LILSALGLISIIGYSVDQRNKEIGIRMAIGATAIEIQRLILREGMRPVLAGLVVGMAAAVALNRLLRSQLVAVSPNDPVVLISALATILVVAIIASLLPIRRAVSVDPVIALRAD
jgi:ABC-type antimicrobial peptide transport system permease subunit